MGESVKTSSLSEKHSVTYVVSERLGDESEPELIHTAIEEESARPESELGDEISDHLSLLSIGKNIDLEAQNAAFEELRSTPLMSMCIRKAIPERLSSTLEPFPQYGLLAGRLDVIEELSSCGNAAGTVRKRQLDPRIFLNVNAPWSAFICGSQGSGKSHTMSCILENCLFSSPRLGSLPKPLSGLVFHYDTFSSAFGGQVCEAAYLCSSGINVTVLVSPSNYTRMATIYKSLPGLKKGTRLPKVEPLVLHPQYLNAERLMTLMAAGTADGPVPLYMQTVLQVLREMAREFPSAIGINYAVFRCKILNKALTPAQLSPLNLRLELLESFLAKSAKVCGNDWTPGPGKLTIVDLSCPFVDSDTACGLFEMCLGIFLEQKMDIGRIVALDEAHKFMGQTVAAKKLSESLKTVIRLQRHLATRVIIATQEPTISTELLDLCSVTLVHRFTSPAWLKALKSHLAAPSAEGDSKFETGIFGQIIRLNVGEALLFAPSAMLDVSETTIAADNAKWKIEKLGLGYLHVRVRNRITLDGGRSKYAS